MALVFLSYDRDDAPFAKRVAAALQEAGHKVWWDDLIKGGSQYTKAIEDALNTSDVVVVLWSQNSVQSAWVRDEAAAGRDRGCLVPVLIQNVEPPLGFRQFQNIDLSRWNGRGKPDQLRQLLDAMPETQAEAVAVPNIALPTPTKTAPSRIRYAWLAIVLVAILAGSYAAWRFLAPSKSSEVPLVAVVAGNETATAKDWARDLTVGLGGLEGEAARSFRLVDQSQQKPDLLIEVTGAAPNQRQASLVLRSTVDRSILWSREFKRPESSIVDMQREIVGAGALVLHCAQRGLSGKQPLGPALLRDYVSACWSMLGSDPANLRELATTFLQLTKAEPKFENGWAGLLLAEANLILYGSGSKQLREDLKKHIEEARRLNPGIAEIYLAEIALLPPNDVSGRIRLAEKAVELEPANAQALIQRAFERMAVGRMTSAIEDGMGAVRTQPFSPWVRDMYVYLLQGAGQYDEASKEIDESGRLWPKADQLWFMRLRQPDPSQTLALLKARKGALYDRMVEEAQTSALEAEIDTNERNVQIAIDSNRALARRSPGDTINLIGVLALFGRTDEALATISELKARPDLYPRFREIMFFPDFQNFWRDPRSMQVAKQLGVLEYWRSSGNWPDFCFEPDHPYDCKAVAQKLPS